MPYDISLVCPLTRQTLEIDVPHFIQGGTHSTCGTKDLWLNVTYNYRLHFEKVLGSKGIRSIYGMTGMDSIPVLKEAIRKLGDDVVDDYWEPTEGNAKEALKGLLAFARMRPDGIWEGD